MSQRGVVSVGDEYMRVQLLQDITDEVVQLVWSEGRINKLEMYMYEITSAAPLNMKIVPS